MPARLTSVLTDIQQRVEALINSGDDDAIETGRALADSTANIVKSKDDLGVPEDVIAEFLEGIEREARAAEVAMVAAANKGSVMKAMTFGEAMLKCSFRRPAKRRRKKVAVPSQVGKFRITVPFAKVEDEKHMVYGWASVTSVAGETVVDHQGDMIDIADLAKSVHEFMETDRDGGVMHIVRDGQPVKVGTIVESIILTDDLKKTLGIDDDREGWYIGFKVHDETVWKMVKDGTLKAFSIGGRGVRTPVE